MGQRTFILVKKNYKNNNGKWASRLSFIYHQWGIGRVMQGLLLQEVLATQFQMDRSLNVIYTSPNAEIIEGDDGYLLQPISRYYNFKPLNSLSNNDRVLTGNFKELELIEQPKPREFSYYEADHKTLKKELDLEGTVIMDYPCDYKLNIFDTNILKKYRDITDNNNGCMIVEVTQVYDKDNREAESIVSNAFNVKVGFCTGSEEEDFYHETIGSCYDRVVYNPSFSVIVSPSFYASHTYSNSEKAMKEFTKSLVTICKQADVKFVYDHKKEKELLEMEKNLTEICNSLAKKGMNANDIVTECNKIVKGRNLCYS